jgi:hypothetical protein
MFEIEDCEVSYNFFKQFSNENTIKIKLDLLNNFKRNFSCFVQWIRHQT